MAPSDDPMHIDNVRARRAADAAERDMYRELAREIDGPPVTLVGMLRRALESSSNEPETRI